MDYCMCAYGAKNLDCQIKNSPILTESQFVKFNARQIFSLYGTYFSKGVFGRNMHINSYIAAVAHFPSPFPTECVLSYIHVPFP